jgi:hypothetical protein
VGNFSEHLWGASPSAIKAAQLLQQRSGHALPFHELGAGSSLWLMLDGRGDSDSACCGDSDESVARRAGEPAGQGENVLGEFGWVEDLELGTEDGHVDGEHVR